MNWIERKIKWIIYKLDGLVPKIHDLPDVVYIKSVSYTHLTLPTIA
mgnify:CR=1 FL=1